VHETFNGEIEGEKRKAFLACVLYIFFVHAQTRGGKKKFNGKIVEYSKR
jgi:hypothetical protein